MMKYVPLSLLSYWYSLHVVPVAHSQGDQYFAGYEYYVEFDLTDNIADEDSYGRFYLNLLGQHNSSEAEFSR